MTIVQDGTLTFRGGQNDGLLPNQIRKDQFRRGINVTTRKGALGPRYGLVHQEIEVLTEGGVHEMTYAQIFAKGKFQAAIEDDPYMLVVFSGVIFRVDPRRLTAEVVKIGDEDDRMNQYRRRIPRTEAGRFIVFFDYPNLPVIVENGTARRANPDRESIPGVSLPEVPSSVLGAFVESRLWVGNDGHEFGAGDPVGGINEDAPITFEESLAPAAAFNGQFFSLGSQSANYPISAMGFLQVPDTSTGVGPLIVATRRTVHAYQVDIPRAQWENTRFGRILLYNAGIAGPRAMANVNSDLFFFGGDNQIRSLLMGRGDQERWGNNPISIEVSPFLKEFENQPLIELAFCQAWSNRVFISVAPYVCSALDTMGNETFDYAHGGMVVMELDSVSELGSDSPPAWAGLWTGISPMEMVLLEQGPFIISKDDGDVNRIYFMDETKRYDVFEGKEVPITSRFYSREYDFENKFMDKKLGRIDYAVTEIEGPMHMVSEYRPAHAVRWSLWKDFTYEGRAMECDRPCPECGDDEMPILGRHSFRQLDLGDPEEVDCDEVTEDQTTIIREIAIRTTITARNWQVEGLRLAFEAIEEGSETSRPACLDTREELTMEEECERSDWDIHRTAPRDARWQ